MERSEPRAFTLIELLIVVAIIAILAAIAVPNFLEAQVRAKVSRTKADQRTLATALEAYAVDENTYPPNPTYGPSPYTGCDTGFTEIPYRLSTPVAYIANGLLIDSFGWALDYGDGNPAYYSIWNFSKDDCSMTDVNTDLEGIPTTVGTFTFLPIGEYMDEGRYVIGGVGPDQVSELYRLYYHSADSGYPQNWAHMIIGMATGVDGIYDPTNGTVSVGDIVRDRRGVNSGK